MLEGYPNRPNPFPPGKGRSKTIGGGNYVPKTATAENSEQIEKPKEAAKAKKKEKKPERARANTAASIARARLAALKDKRSLKIACITLFFFVLCCLFWVLRYQKTY